MLLNLCGIAFMLGDFKLVPVLVSFLAGVGVVMNRLVNSQMARHTTTHTGVFYNYLVGLLAALVVLFISGSRIDTATLFKGPPTVFLGGGFGVVIVLLSNHVVRRIPSLYMTMALFVGQVFAAVLLDMLISQSFPLRILVGGLFVLLGLSLNLWQDSRLKSPDRTPDPVPFGTGGVHYRTVPFHQKTMSFDGEEGPWSECPLMGFAHQKEAE